MREERIRSDDTKQIHYTTDIVGLQKTARCWGVSRAMGAGGGGTSPFAIRDSHRPAIRLIIGQRRDQRRCFPVVKDGLQDVASSLLLVSCDSLGQLVLAILIQHCATIPDLHQIGESLCYTSLTNSQTLSIFITITGTARDLQKTITHSAIHFPRTFSLFTAQRKAAISFQKPGWAKIQPCKYAR